MGLFSRVKDWDDGDNLTEPDLEAEFDNIYDSVVAGTVTAVGMVQLEDSHTSTSITKAACPKNVKEAYDLGETHKNRHDPENGADPLDTATPPELAGVQATGEGSSHSLARADHQHQIQHSIANNHIVTIDHAAVADNDYAKFTASGLEGRDKAQVLSDLNVEDGADVTDAVNLASVTHGVAAKPSMVNADELGLIDSAASWVLKKFTFTNLKAFLKTYFDTLYAVLGVNADITSMTGLDDNGIPLAKIANAASDGANGDITSMTGLSVGGIPVAKVAGSTQNNQTDTTYTLVIGDAFKLITFGNAAAIAVTIPTNAAVAFPVGTQIDCVQILAGKPTFSGAGVTINSKDGNKAIGGQWVGITLIKTATDTWLLLGDLIA